MKCFTADFETTTDIDDCRVWAYALCEIGNVNNFLYGNNIESFIDFCKNPKENYKILFHNLKFDGEYIFSYLLKDNVPFINPGPSLLYTLIILSFISSLQYIAP